MTKIKSIFLFVCLIFVAIVFAGCGKSDEIPPEIELKQQIITHAVNTDIDFKEYVTVSDNETATNEIKIEVSDYNGYDKSVAGTYEVTIKATDKEGNFVTKKITVVVKTDMLAPIVTGSVVNVNHLAGETVDLTKGLQGVDNIDGVNVTFAVSDYGTYNKDVPGTYTVKITVSDKAGNVSAPFNRTIVVSESFSRAEMVSFAGDTINYKALYNPQVLNGNTGTGYNTAYDGDYVNVLSKDYVEWLLEYAPERFGSGIGWSVVAVTNDQDEIVYVRHWNSGEAFFDSNNQLVSQKAKNWSTGTVYSWNETIDNRLVTFSNAKYSSGEMGLMLANINEWIPENGHLFIFMNWSTIQKNESNVVVLKPNASDMPRSMGANYIMNSDENADDVMDYAIGRELKIIDSNLSDQTVRKSFDPENPFPIISIPSKKYTDKNGIWKNDYTDVVYLENASSYDPLYGVTADNGKGVDITANITYKLYKYQTAEIKYGLVASLPITDPIWSEYFDDNYQLSESEITLAEALTQEYDNYYFVVEYTVEANGQTDKAYRLIKVASKNPDYIELYDNTDSVYSKVMGIEQRLEMNPDLDEFGEMNATEKGILYDGLTFKNLSTLPVLPKGMIVVLDQYYQVQLIRISNGSLFEIDAHGVVKTTELGWTAEDMFVGLSPLVENSGYVVVYPEGFDSSILTKALKAFYDFDYITGAISTVNFTNGIVKAELVIKEVTEVSTLVVNTVAPKISINNIEQTIQVITNSKDSLVFVSTGGGAGFRLDMGKAYYYNKDIYATLVSSAEVVNSFTTSSPNKGVPWFRDGVIIVFDANGKFVLARVMTTSTVAEVKADGTVIFGNAAAVATTEAAKLAAGTNNLTWDVVIPNAANTASHGPLVDIQSVIPDGGSFMILPGTANSAVRNYAIQLVWNKNYAAGFIVDATLPEQPAGNPSPATNGFDSTNYTATYYTDLAISVDFVSTVLDKPAKLVRPDVLVTGNTATWKPITGAASYDIYVDGVLSMKNVGTLSEDQTTYSYNLGLLSLAEATYQIQVRAITADVEVNATSVLSDKTEYLCDRLESPSEFILEDNVVSWKAIEGASKYLVQIDEGTPFEVTTNSAIIPDANLVAGTVVKVISSGSETILDSLVTEYILDIEVIEKEITISSVTLPMKEFTVSSWMRYASPTGGNDVGAANVEGLVVINGAENIANLADTDVVFAGGYAVLLDSTLKVKYYADRWTHQWNPTAGWSQTETVSPWAWGTKLYASYFKPYVAAGDILVIASQYGKGLTEGTYRNILGNQILKDQGSAVLTSANDHRTVTDLTTAINPTNVVISIKEKVKTKTISLGNNDLPLVEYDLTSWMKYASPTGGNDVGGQNVGGIILVTGANGIQNLADTDVIFAGGYVAIVGSDMKFKYFADRWTHEWNPTAGWTQRETVSPWAWGTKLYASYFKPYLAEGDMLIMASQYSKGLPAGTYRNYLGNALIKDLGVVTGDHRAVLPADCIDLSTITISFKEAVKVIKLANYVLDVKEYDLASWMNYASATGGNDVGGQFISGIIIVTGANGIQSLADTDVIFAGGYVAVVGADMKIKYFADRWTHEWNPTAGWTQRETATWTWGAKLYASYFKPYLAEGDMLIIASQYKLGLVSGTYRNIMGTAFIKDLGSITADHRAVLPADCIDLSTMTVSIMNLE